MIYVNIIWNIENIVAEKNRFYDVLVGTWMLVYFGRMTENNVQTGLLRIMSFYETRQICHETKNCICRVGCPIRTGALHTRIKTTNQISDVCLYDRDFVTECDQCLSQTVSIFLHHG